MRYKTTIFRRQSQNIIDEDFVPISEDLDIATSTIEHDGDFELDNCELSAAKKQKLLASQVPRLSPDCNQPKQVPSASQIQEKKLSPN